MLYYKKDKRDKQRNVLDLDNFSAFGIKLFVSKYYLYS